MTTSDHEAFAVVDTPFVLLDLASAVAGGGLLGLAFALLWSLPTLVTLSGLGRRLTGRDCA